MASLLAGALLLTPSLASAAMGKTYSSRREEEFYAACYIFTAGEPVAYIFPTVKTNGQEMFNYFEKNLGDRLLPLFPQHHVIRCVVDDTPAMVAQRLTEHHYDFQPHAWPKGLPDGARPVYVEGKGFVPRDQAPVEAGFVACLKSHETGVYVTAAFPAATPDYRRKIDADAQARWGASNYVDCKTRPTAEEAARAVRGAYSVTPKAWPLPWGDGAKVATPKPAPKPTPSPQTASLTVKTDTSAKDAAKAWDEQVKKTLAAEAQKKVETAARQAQADAKRQAEIAAFFAERRKQGRAQ